MESNQSPANTQQDKPFVVDPMGFDKHINYPYEYHKLMGEVAELQRTRQYDAAITHYNMGIAKFGSVFDEIYIRNCYIITKMNLDNFAKHSMLVVEFSRLMTRSGIAPKPDIRIRYKAMWDVPIELSDLSFDGKDKQVEKRQEQVQELADKMLRVADEDKVPQQSNMEGILCPECYKMYMEAGKDMPVCNACDKCQDKLAKVILSLVAGGE